MSFKSRSLVWWVVSMCFVPIGDMLAGGLLGVKEKDGVSELVIANPNSGEIEILTGTGFEDVSIRCFDVFNGVIYLLAAKYEGDPEFPDVTNHLLKIDLVTGTISSVPLSKFYYTWSFVNGELRAIRFGGVGFDLVLVRLDPETGAEEEIGVVAENIDLPFAAAVDGEFAFLNITAYDGASGVDSKILTVDLVTGAVSEAILGEGVFDPINSEDTFHSWEYSKGSIIGIRLSHSGRSKFIVEKINPSTGVRSIEAELEPLEEGNGFAINYENFDVADNGVVYFQYHTGQDRENSYLVAIDLSSGNEVTVTPMEDALMGFATVGTFSTPEVSIESSVSARVLDAMSGVPIGGASVSVGDLSSVTGENGTFLIQSDSDDFDGAASIEIAADGYDPLLRVFDSVPEGAALDFGDILLQESSSVPAVTYLDGDLNCLFPHGLGLTMEVTAGVDWKGYEPGEIRFLANGETVAVVPGSLTVPGAGLEYKAAIDVDEAFVPSLRSGANSVSVVTVSDDGVLSEPFESEVFVFPLPDWLAFLADEDSEWTTFPGHSIGIDFAVPPTPYSKVVTLPWKDLKFGVDLQVNSSFDYELNTGDWEFLVGLGDTKKKNKRGRRPSFPGVARSPKTKLYVGNKEINVLFSGVGKGGTSALGGLVLESLGGTVKTDAEFELGRYSVTDLNAAVSAALSILGLEDDLDILRLVVNGKLGMAGSFIFNTNPEIEYERFELSGSMGLEAALQAEVFGNDAEVYGGGRGTIVLQYPGDLFKEILIEFYVGVKVDIWVFTTDYEGVILEYKYPSNGEQAPTEIELTSIAGSVRDGNSGLKVMDRPWRESGGERFVFSNGPNVNQWKVQEIDAESGPPTDEATASNQAAFEGLLVENVFPKAEPDIASHGEQLMIVYVGDNGNQIPTQFTEIRFMVFDGEEWSEPAPISGAPNAQFSPQVCFDGNGDAIAVWQQINDANFSDADLSLYASKMEIVWSRWDRDTRVWSAPLSITDNTFLDHRPQLAGPIADGDLIVAWTSNQGNEMRGEGVPGAATNSIFKTVRWDRQSLSWSMETEVVNDLVGELSLSVAAQNDQALFVWTKDHDGDLANMSDTELFSRTLNTSTGVFGSIERRTDDAVPDINAKVVIANDGTVVPVWQREGEWVMDRNFSGSPVAVRSTGEGLEYADFELNGDSENGVFVIWEGESESGRDMFYRRYDPVAEVWGGDSQISNDTDLEHSFSAVSCDDGSIAIVHNEVELTLEKKTGEAEEGEMVEVEGVPTAGTTSLSLVRRYLTNDVSLVDGSLVAEGDDFLPGDAVTISVVARNGGDFAHGAVDVSFFDGDPDNGGGLIEMVSLDGTLLPSEDRTIQVEWTIPEPAVARTIYAVINTEGVDDNLENNSRSLNLNSFDLDITLRSKSVSEDGAMRVVARVTNLGAPNSPQTTIELWRSGSPGTHFLEARSVPVLPPRGYSDVVFDLPPGTHPDGQDLYELRMRNPELLEDVGLDNNALFFSVLLVVDQDGDGLPRYWEQRHGMSDSTSEDADLDSDKDGFTSLEEYLAGTDPSDSNSYLHVGDYHVIQNPSGPGSVAAVTWRPSFGVSYVIERSYDLINWEEIDLEIERMGELNMVVDEVISPTGRVFYRVTVR